MNQREGHNQDELSIAALLRMAADGELDERQDAALRAHLEAHPEDQERVEFERRLRDACRCACAPECCAPPGLLERVRACCTEDAPADRLGAGAGQTRDRGFWAGRMVARFGAIAALIALVAVVSFMVGRTGVVPTAGLGAVDPHTMVERVARFVRKEHDRCADGPPAVNPKFTVHRVEEVPAEFEALMGKAVTLQTVFDAESQGLRFVDAGECHLPTGTALHIRFQPDDPNACMVSLWAQPDDGSLPIEEGVPYTCGEGTDRVRFWLADDVRYVLVCPDPGVAPAAERALNCPPGDQSH